MQWRKKTNSSFNNRPAQKDYGEWIVWPESVCSAVFFFFVLFLFCLARIFVYLRFPGGNCGLSVCSVRVLDSQREQASMWVSQRVCNVLSSWSLSWTLRPSEEDNSCQIWDKKRDNPHFSVLIGNLFVCSLFVWLFFLSFVLDSCPKGCKRCRIPQDCGRFLKNLDASIHLLYISLSLLVFSLPSCGISCFYVFWSHRRVRMSVLRWHRLSALWKNWMFNQEPAEEQDQISESPTNEKEPQKKEENSFKDHNDCQNSTAQKSQNSDYKNQKSEIQTQNLELTNLKSVPKTQKPELLKRSCSEPCSQVSSSEDQSCSCPWTPEGCGFESHRSCYSEEGVDCVLQVDNGSEGDDSFLQREGSQRRSRRRFRRVNPRGERELITDGQEPASYNTVGVTSLLGTEANALLFTCWMQLSEVLLFACALLDWCRTVSSFHSRTITKHNYTLP